MAISKKSTVPEVKDIGRRLDRELEIKHGCAICWETSQNNVEAVNKCRICERWLCQSHTKKHGKKTYCQICWR